MESKIKIDDDGSLPQKDDLENSNFPFLFFSLLSSLPLPLLPLHLSGSVQLKRLEKTKGSYSLIPLLSKDRCALGRFKMRQVSDLLEVRWQLTILQGQVSNLLEARQPPIIFQEIPLNFQFYRIIKKFPCLNFQASLIILFCTSIPNIPLMIQCYNELYTNHNKIFFT